MKLLVTGGAGYIGSITAELLLQAGHQVVVADNLSRGHREAVPPGAEFRAVDLLDAEATDRLLESDFEAVLHFAALSLVGESVEQPEKYYRTNVGGTLNLLEAMTKSGTTNLVFSSTAAVYGQPDKSPIDEDAPTNPTNPYGATKLAVDRMIRDFCSAHGTAAISLRYFNVAGASEQLGEDHHPETHLIPNALAVAAGVEEELTVYGSDYPTEDGTCIRDYIHIVDLAGAHLLALDRLQAGEHQIYNLGNGAGFSVQEVIEAARSVTGKPIPAKLGPRRPGDPAVLVASSAKIIRELGWRPARAQLEKVVEDAWLWRLANPKGYGD